jgi:hypothetical protein
LESYAVVGRLTNNYDEGAESGMMVEFNQE